MLDSNSSTLAKHAVTSTDWSSWQLQFRREGRHGERADGDTHEPDGSGDKLLRSFIMMLGYCLLVSALQGYQ
eukprot:m.10670 g.10670  ORF g.10670 m.10670 type:complete len:72 (+) comp9647_c0_seq1:490-705(+)